MAKIAGSKRVTREDLETYFKLEEQRLDLQRKSKEITALQTKLEEKFRAHVDACGGAEKSVVTCGYRIYLTIKAGSVKWKDEFLRLCELAGRKPLEEAAKLVAAAPPKEELVVEAPDSLVTDA